MADGIVIPLKADDKQIKQATKSLGILEKALNWVGKAAGENKDELAKFADILSPFASVAPAFASAIKSYIIAPLSGAVNGFMALGDQISKTSQRIGMSTETLGGLKFATEECGANFEILTEGIKAFQNQLGAAQMGDTGAISKLGKVGLDVDDFAGLSNEDQLMKLDDFGALAFCRRRWELAQADGITSYCQCAGGRGGRDCVGGGPRLFLTGN